jgi:hypothetical protein
MIYHVLTGVGDTDDINSEFAGYVDCADGSGSVKGMLEMREVSAIIDPYEFEMMDGDRVADGDR